MSIKLVGVAITKACQYHGMHSLDYAEKFGIDDASCSSAKAALFVYGSKIAHSCLPNVSPNTKTEDGCIEYKVIRPLKKGDLVEFAYIGNIFVTPMPNHHKTLLWQSTSLFCQCACYLEPNHSRVIVCPRSKCTGQALCGTYIVTIAEQWNSINASMPETYVDYLRCQTCGILGEDLLERKLRFSSKSLELRDSSGNNILPSELLKLCNTASCELSPMHYMVFKILLLTTKVCASHAVGIEQATGLGMLPRNARTPFGTSSNMRRKAAVSGFDYISACAYITVGCSIKGCRSTTGKRNHPPVNDCVTNVLFAWQDLAYVQKWQWPI
jgi:hypothetical protein